MSALLALSSGCLCQNVIFLKDAVDITEFIGWWVTSILHHGIPVSLRKQQISRTTVLWLLKIIFSLNSDLYLFKWHYNWFQTVARSASVWTMNLWTKSQSIDLGSRIQWQRIMYLPVHTLLCTCVKSPVVCCDQTVLRPSLLSSSDTLSTGFLRDYIDRFIL